MLIYKKMSLFDAPPGSALMHACNAQGVWGSGIAREFKRRFPYGHKDYEAYCFNERDILGTAFITSEHDYAIINLITSSGFGTQVDSVDSILLNTRKALQDLFNKIDPNDTVIYCNKFNSGLFNVPWEQTAKILDHFSTKNKVFVVVCDPNL